MKKAILILSLLFSGYLSQAQCAFTVTVLSNTPTCFGFCDGSITLNVQGATGNVTFDITDSVGTNVNFTSNTANNLCKGWYYWSVTDESPCTETDSIYLNEPGPLTPNGNSTDVLCNGGSDGTLLIDTVYNIAGTMNSTSFFWNPSGNEGSGSGQNSQSGLPSGNHSVTIIDDNGCSINFDFTINEPQALSWSDFGSDPDSCNGNPWGVVWMSATGGTPDYDYLWTDLQNSMNVSMNTTWGGLAAGCYEGKVVDANGCELIDTICIGCLSFIEPAINWELYPNPSNGSFTLVSDHNGIAQLKVYNMAGSIVYSETMSQSKVNIELTNAEAGIYWIILETAEGIARRKVVIE